MCKVKDIKVLQSLDLALNGIINDDPDLDYWKVTNEISDDGWIKVITADGYKHYFKRLNGKWIDFEHTKAYLNFHAKEEDQVFDDIDFEVEET